MKRDEFLETRDGLIELLEIAGLVRNDCVVDESLHGGCRSAVQAGHRHPHGRILFDGQLSAHGRCRDRGARRLAVFALGLTAASIRVFTRAALR